MHKQFQELISVLGKQLSLFKEFRDLLIQEHQPLVDLNVVEIEALNKAKQTLELRLKILEQARSETVAALAQEFQIPPGEATLKKLAELAPSPQMETLQKARKALIRLTQEIKRKLEDNGRLVHSSLRVIQGLQQMILRGIEEPATYEEAGRVRKTHPVASLEGRRV